jgi:hypothetical protein
MSDHGVQPTTGDDMENVSVTGDGQTLAPAQGTTDGSDPIGPLNRRRTLAVLAIAGLCASALFVTSLPATKTPDAPKPVGVGNALGRPAGMAEDAARMSSYPMWGGHPILKAGPDVTDEAGNASAWILDGQKVDPEALLERLKRWTGASGPLRDEYGTLSIGDDGSSVSVSRDELRTYNAWISSRNPWSCPATAPMMVDPSVAGSEVAPDSPPAGSSPGFAGMVGTEVCPAVNRDAIPSDADAVRQAKAVFEQIGIDVTQFSFSAQRSDLSVDVIATLMVAGRSTTMTSNASVGPLGVFSIYGFAAQPRSLPDYPVVGARTAALRSIDPRWNQFGPLPYGNWGQVMPMAATRDATLSEPMVGTSVMKDTPIGEEPSSIRPVRSVNGRPVLVAYVAEVNVNTAILELSQFSLSDGQVVLLPVWVYTASDGSRWSMLAITDEHVEFIAS